MSSRTRRPNGDVTGAVSHEPRDLLERLIHHLADAASDSSEICELIDALEQAVEHRFASEEDNEQFEEALAQAPWLTAAALNLKLQQMELRQLLGLICRKAREADGSLAWRRSLQVELSDFMERFLEHEVGRENLIQDAFRTPSWVFD